MSEWYYAENGNTYGPFSQEELKSMLETSLPKDTMVWRNGFSDWIHSETLPEFSYSQTQKSIKINNPTPMNKQTQITKQNIKHPTLAETIKKNTASSGFPSLWNPSAAVNWSLPFTPIFGAWLQAKNWQALNEPDKAKKSMLWVYVGIAWVPVNLFIYMPAIWVFYLLGWYFISGKQQIKYLKNNSVQYKKKSWWIPLLIALGSLIIIKIIIDALAALSQQYPA